MGDHPPRIARTPKIDKRSPSHERIQAGGVILSLIVSFLALGISWLTYSRSTEDIAATVVPITGHRIGILNLDGAYRIERRFDLFLANRSTEGNSITSVFVSDDREPSSFQQAQIMNGERPEEFTPIMLQPGESRKVVLGYYEKLPIECSFPELRNQTNTRQSWQALNDIFLSHQRTFPFCDAFPEPPTKANVIHQRLSFLIRTAHGNQLVRRAFEKVEFAADGSYSIWFDPPVPKGD